MSTTYELTGTVHRISETQTFASGFTKREFIVETADEKYPQTIKLEAVKDGCAKLDPYREGDDITVSFNLRGNEYNGKYYVSLQAWKIEGDPSGAGQKPAERPQQRSMPPAPAMAAMDDSLDEDSEIPF